MTSFKQLPNNRRRQL